jgi:hypothetical protein
MFLTQRGPEISAITILDSRASHGSIWPKEGGNL